MTKRNTRKAKADSGSAREVKPKFLEQRNDQISSNPLKPMNSKQKEYIKFIQEKSIILATGYPGTSKCVTGDTLVPTGQGLLYISELSEEEGYTPLEVDVKDRSGKSKTSAFLKTTTDALIHIQTSFGYSIKCTPEHPLLVFTGKGYEWVKAEDLTKEDILCISRSTLDLGVKDAELDFKFTNNPLARNTKDCEIPNVVTKELSEFCGYVLANAVLTKNSIHFSSHDPKIQKRFKVLCEHLFSLSPSEVRKGEKCVGMVLCSVVATSFVNFIFDGFRTARFKSVPYCIRTSSKTCWRAFLKGLLDCDSGLDKGTLTFISASEEVANVYHKLLLEFGIISCKAPRIVKGYDHTYWKVTTYGEETKRLFEDILYDSNKYDASALGSQKQYNKNKDLIHKYKDFISSSISSARSKLGVGQNGTYPYKGKCNNRFVLQNLPKGRVNTSKELTYEKLRQTITQWECSPEEQREEILDLLVLAREIESLNYFYAEISEISRTCEEAVVYDLTVPETSSFIANGIVSHNTFIPTVIACDKYRKGEIDKIYLIRPFISKSKSPGFYAGTLQEKASIWLGEIVSVMKDRLGNDALELALRHGDVEFLPLEVLKGRSLKSCFVICDEAEDITVEEAKKIVTRVGENCTMVLSGDIGQVDLSSESGLKYLKELAEENPELEKTVGVVDFNQAGDIVRSETCKVWTMAIYRKDTKQKSEAQR